MPYKKISPAHSAGCLLLKIRIATHQIEGARKQAVSGFDEKLRVLRDLDARLATLETIAQPELFDAGSYLSPEVESLLAAPLADQETK